MEIAELIKKDFRLITEMQRSSLIVVLFLIFIAFVLTPMLSDTSSESYFYSYPLPFLLFLSFLFIQDMWAEEGKEKAINALLYSGTDVRSIWVAKSVASFVFSYGVLLFCGFVYGIFKGSPSSDTVSAGLLIQPCLCFLLLLQVSAIFLFVRNYGYAALLSILVLPFVILYYLWIQSVGRIFLLFVILLAATFMEFLGFGKISLERVTR